MTISIYAPAVSLPNEAARERAVEASGALARQDDPALTGIVIEARRAAGMTQAALPIVYRDWQYVIAADGMPTGVLSRRTSFCGHAIAGREPFFCVLDAAGDSRFAGNPLVLDGEVRSYVGALVFGEDRTLPLGTLCAFDPAPRTSLSPALVNAFLALAQRVGAQLASARVSLPLSVLRPAAAIATSPHA